MRDLYELFRDGVIDDAIQNTAPEATSPWAYLPKTDDKSSKPIGRMQTVALVRRFMARAAKEYPGGIVVTKGGLTINETFIEFIKTHREMKTSPEDISRAWVAMQGIMDGQ